MIYRMPAPIHPSQDGLHTGLRSLRASRPLWLVCAMIFAASTVATLAYWDEKRESAAALEDFAEEQARLARSLAQSLESRLAEARRDALLADEDTASGRPIHPSILASYLAVRPRAASDPALPQPTEYRALSLAVPVSPSRKVDLLLSTSNLVAGIASVERPRALTLLVLPPGQSEFQATDGRSVKAEKIRNALQDGQTSLRLDRESAGQLGLPPRTALAGLARIDAGTLGGWGIAAVATAERERDRAERARWRLLLAVMLAGGLVFVFGGLALRNQRKELLLERELAIADLGHERDERLERASKAATMGTLAMGIAHEISTPLGIIVGRAEQLLPKVAGDERANRSVKAIVEQSERINQVIRAFLGLARGDSPSSRSVSPAAVVQGALALVEHRLAKAGVQLAVDIAQNPPPLHGDLHLLEHALVNLLLNACDACARGGRVELAVRWPNETILFTVDDDGVGISPAHLARAMEPFFTTKAELGSGLGLAVAHEIVKSHRGTLSVTARVPRGTRASIELPLDGSKTNEAA
jgi:signal transduction histidine kinase